MQKTLAYALLTPDSVAKSRAGGILSRLLAETGLELVGAGFLPGSRQLADAFRDEFVDPEREALLFILSGEAAIEKTATVARALRSQFGHAVLDRDGSRISRDFVLAFAESDEAAADTLAFLAECVAQPGFHTLSPTVTGHERTLVLLKPDNFEYPSIRPGALLDHFARTGLYLRAMKVHHMSVAEAETFYAPVLPVLQEVFRESHGEAVNGFLEKTYEETLRPEDRSAIATCVGPIMGRLRWEALEFMCGHRPSEAAPEQRDAPGSRKCLALIYEGNDAVARVRAILGPTDATRAPAGTVRREFARTLMVNAAHASDSAVSAAREMEILAMAHNPLAAVLYSRQPLPAEAAP